MSTLTCSIPNGTQCRHKQPKLVLVHPSKLSPPPHDIRDRTTKEYRDFLDRLIPDLKARGFQVPIIAWSDEPRLWVLDGETRRQGSLLAGLDEVQVLVYDEKPDESDLKIGMLLANSMRQGMTPLEEAAVYVDLIQLNDWTQSELARQLHVSPAHVAKILAISTRACPEVRAMLSAGLGVRSVYAISKLPDAPAQIALGQKALQMKYSVEDIEIEVVRILTGGNKQKEKPLVLKADGIEMKIKKPTSETIRGFLDKIATALKRLKPGDDINDLNYHIRAN